MASPLRALLAYLDSFEVAYDSDDWALLDRHFSEDAVYRVIAAPLFAGEWPTRAGIKRQFKNICDAFDRRFDERIVGQAGRPRFQGDAILFGWQATYKLKGAPDFLLIGKSLARIAGDQIIELEDIISPENCAEAEKYLHEYDAKLKPAGMYMPIRQAMQKSAATGVMLAALWSEIQSRYGFEAANPMAFTAFELPRSALYLAYASEKPIGSIGFYPLSESEAELDSMYVAPDFRGTGLAQRLLAVVERVALQNRYKAIKLRAGEPQPEAIRFYEKSGFKRIESFGKWKSDPTALCFEKELKHA